MTISGTGSTNSSLASAYTSPSSGQVDNPNANLKKDHFLQMLITKLKYQDPLKAAEMDEGFIADMAQFSSLEQMTTMNSGFAMTNSSLQDLNYNIIGLMLMQNTTQAASLIGKTVTIGYQATDSTTGKLIDKTITGTVSVVRFVEGTPKLVVNGIEYDLSQVKEITA